MRRIPGIGYWPVKAALMHPDRTALVVPEGRVSYRELDERVGRAAAALAGLGVGPGSRFGILMRNDRRFLELLFAAGQLGAVAVPLNWRLSVPELEYVVSDAGIELVVVGPEDEAAGAALAASRGVRLLSAPAEYDALLAAAAVEARPRYQHEIPGDDDPVLQIYTSGTTGRPKGAVLTHANMFWNAINDVLALGLTFQDVSLTILPLMHVGGIGLFTLPTLLAGGTVAMPRAFDPAETLEWIGRERVTLFIGVPTVHRMLVEAPEFDGADLSSLRFVYNGGDRCPLEVVARYRARGLPFAGGYGLTETAPTAYLTELDQIEKATRAEGYAGKPSYSLDVRLVGEDGRDVGPEEVGEVWVRGPNLFLEYWGQPEQTAASFEDGWFRTGDLAWADEDGYTFVSGRKKEMIKSGGENIYPAEVERVLLEHPAVGEAVVIGRAHAKWNEVPFAVVAPKPGQRLEAAALREHCEARLARFKVPTGFAVLDAIPRTAIGKPDRPALLARYGQAVEAV